VRLIVDRATASVPWEMACFETRSGGDVRWLGLDLRLSRQFRSLLTQPPGTTPPLNDHLKVLVIADPAKERELQLPFARMEGRRVVDVLRRMNRPGLRIDVESRIGPSECDMVEILAQVLIGGFDVVHFAGHGDYDPADPMRSGWIFGRDQVLTARDIFRARRVPRLIFANACFSGVVRDAAAQAPDELSKGLASIAQAFFERGVPNFIGSGWPIGDQQAAGFAETFSQYIVEVSPEGGSDRPETDPNAESVLFLMEGELVVTVDGDKHEMTSGGYGFIPPGADWTIHHRGDAPRPGSGPAGSRRYRTAGTRLRREARCPSARPERPWRISRERRQPASRLRRRWNRIYSAA